jgi:hypothetical protein
VARDRNQGRAPANTVNEPVGCINTRKFLSSGATVGLRFTGSFVAYIMMLSVPRTSRRRKTARLVKNGLERMWKEVVVARFQVLPRHFPGRTEG